MYNYEVRLCTVDSCMKFEFVSLAEAMEFAYQAINNYNPNNGIKTFAVEITQVEDDF